MDLLGSLTRLFSVVALVAALYAGYELLFKSATYTRWRDVLARAWIFLLLGTVGVDEIFFGQNAVLAAGYFLALPLPLLQIGVLASILVASYVWIGS